MLAHFLPFLFSSSFIRENGGKGKKRGPKKVLVPLSPFPIRACVRYQDEIGLLVLRIWYNPGEHDRRGGLSRRGMNGGVAGLAAVLLQCSWKYFSN